MIDSIYNLQTVNLVVQESSMLKTVTNWTDAQQIPILSSTKISMYSVLKFLGLKSRFHFKSTEKSGWNKFNESKVLLARFGISLKQQNHIFCIVTSDIYQQNGLLFLPTISICNFIFDYTSTPLSVWHNLNSLAK